MFCQKKSKTSFKPSPFAMTLKHAQPLNANPNPASASPTDILTTTDNLLAVAPNTSNSVHLELLKHHVFSNEEKQWRFEGSQQTREEEHEHSVVSHSKCQCRVSCNSFIRGPFQDPTDQQCQPTCFPTYIHEPSFFGSGRHRDTLHLLPQQFKLPSCSSCWSPSPCSLDCLSTLGEHQSTDQNGQKQAGLAGSNFGSKPPSSCSPVPKPRLRSNNELRGQHCFDTQYFAGVCPVTATAATAAASAAAITAAAAA